MDIVISNSSDKPIYQQMFDQISSQIIRGELESGAMLPPIRTVAKELRISIITVKKAWEQLEREGFIYSMVGRGCFVADLSDEGLKNKRSEMTRKKMRGDIEYYKKLGLSLSDVVKSIIELYEE